MFPDDIEDDATRDPILEEDAFPTDEEENPIDGMFGDDAVTEKQNLIRDEDTENIFGDADDDLLDEDGDEGSLYGAL